jgi:hypothetical protein
LASVSGETLAEAAIVAPGLEAFQARNFLDPIGQIIRHRTTVVNDSAYRPFVHAQHARQFGSGITRAAQPAA